MIREITEALVVFRQRFVDICHRYLGVASSNCDLVKIRHDISRSIDSVDPRPLMGIHLQHPTSWLPRRPQVRIELCSRALEDDTTLLTALISSAPCSMRETGPATFTQLGGATRPFPHFCRQAV